MANYRIIKDIHGYYPQIHVGKKYLFGLITITKWLRISKHTQGFGLYNDLDHATTIEECEQRIQEYDKTLKEEKITKPVVVKYITIS